MQPKNIVGKRVRTIRHAQTPRVTQEELASRVQTRGVRLDRTAVAKIENGSRPVTDIELVAIAGALGVSPIRLFEDGGDDD